MGVKWGRVKWPVTPLPPLGGAVFRRAREPQASIPPFLFRRREF
jgi:hypothetical protein